MKYRIGADTGGTFTDVSLVEEETGKSYITKVPSIPENPSLAVINGVEQIVKETGIDFKNISFFIHGTTVGTNTLLELKGAKTALLTTKGFKDVLQIGRQTRPKLYDAKARKSEPLVPRDLRLELDERIDANGNILKEINKEEVIELAKELKSKDIKSLAISFINSYINDTHEIQVKEIFQENSPRLSITLSCEVLPEFKEYERTSTVVGNAYILPIMEYYLNHLKDNLNKLEISSDLYIMQSNGGVISADTAIEMPIRTILSGPAGGVLAGKIVAEESSYKNIITIDMGGTSLDTALIENEEPQFTTISEIDGRPVKVPMIEMNTIGSGGGSIAWIDAGGALRVGPQSAGANPGPVCYGHGGTEPTVSDANAILGRLNPDSILGGKMKMDIKSARKVVKEKIADPLGLTIEEAAEGILKVINVNIVRGIRVVSIEKGHDTRDFSLMAFGGAGPLHAVDIANELGSSEVIIPRNPGITCAEGMLMADVRHDFVQTYTTTFSYLSLSKTNEIVTRLSQQAHEELRTEGFETNEMDLQVSLDLRYVGQAYEITIPLPDIDEITKSSLDIAISDFHKTHEKIYGFNRQSEELELVNIRLMGIGKIKKLKEERQEFVIKNNVKPINKRDVYFDQSFIQTPVYHRQDLNGEVVVNGPAIIEQLDSTIVIHPKQTATADEKGNLIIKIRNKESKEEVKYEYSES